MDKLMQDSDKNEKLCMEKEEKKVYAEPRLKNLGSMQRMTLNGSELNSDSGQAEFTANPQTGG